MTVGFGSKMEAEARLDGLVRPANTSTTLPLHLAMRMMKSPDAAPMTSGNDTTARDASLVTGSAHLDGL
jgi:hypothetical protein